MELEISFVLKKQLTQKGSCIFYCKYSIGNLRVVKNK